jgi:4,5-DOPA dioxygenase extradiol
MDALNKLSKTLHPSSKMPVLFIGHGNPMNAILDNDITKNWKTIGKDLPQAQAIVVISAHWLTNGTHVTDAPTQPIIYDMYNFPDELYQATYPAKGSPQLAALLQKQLAGYEAQLDSTWGLDHGTWSVLKHLAPHPKIPVLQISLDVNQSFDQLVSMFSLLKPLRQKGVIFIGSGNIVHNLRAINWNDGRAYDWALEFDSASAEAMADHRIDLLTRPGKLSGAASFAIPTDDHYRPMLAAMALLGNSEELHYFNEVIEMGSVGMRSFIVND